MTRITPRVVRAEWSKLRSSRSLVWTLVAATGCMIALTAFLAAVGHTDATRAGQGDDDVVVNALRGVLLGQVVIVSFGVLMISPEYATGLIRTTLSATPRRGVVFIAKALLVGASAAVAGIVASIASFMAAQPLLHGGGFVPPAYPIVTLGQAEVLRAVFGTALFLMLLALFAFGLGGLVRHTATAVTIGVGAMLLPTVLSAFLSGRIRDLILQGSPIAGLAIQSTRARSLGVPIGPWAGLAVTSAWAGAALLAAFLVFQVRDV
jgi:ABC-type transport system involved in multi-copper enzyme maturation permease subunit